MFEFCQWLLRRIYGPVPNISDFNFMLKAKAAKKWSVVFIN